jgi:hypothetical protein
MMIVALNYDVAVICITEILTRAKEKHPVLRRGVRFCLLLLPALPASVVHVVQSLAPHSPETACGLGAFNCERSRVGGHGGRSRRVCAHCARGLREYACALRVIACRSKLINNPR